MKCNLNFRSLSRHMIFVALIVIIFVVAALAVTQPFSSQELPRDKLFLGQSFLPIKSIDLITRAENTKLLPKGVSVNG